MAMNTMRRNVPKSLARMSGGECESFAREEAYENRIAEVAKHAHNRCMPSFYLSNPTPGLHRLDVKLAQDLPRACGGARQLLGHQQCHGKPRCADIQVKQTNYNKKRGK